MGAHGRHPLRDLFGTSVTRAVLRACPVPAFVGSRRLEHPLAWYRADLPVTR